jgi:hypothetical protein
MPRRPLSRNLCELGAQMADKRYDGATARGLRRHLALTESGVLFRPMSVCIETYEAMRAAVLAAEHPTGWTLTTELYRQLDYPSDHFATAGRAIHYGETPKPLYQLPVKLTIGADHGWTLHAGAEHG